MTNYFAKGLIIFETDFSQFFKYFRIQMHSDRVATDLPKPSQTFSDLP